MRKVLFIACAVGIMAVGFSAVGHADENNWAITFAASTGGDFGNPSDAAAKALAVSSTTAGVLDDESVRDTKDGSPPAAGQGFPGNASWYRPNWMKNDGTDSTAFPWAFSNDYKQPLSTTPNHVKTWHDLIVWTTPGFINQGTPNDTSDDKTLIHLFVTTPSPSQTAPNTVGGSPVRYKLVLKQAPNGYVPGANGSTAATSGSGTAADPYTFLLNLVPSTGASLNKYLIADIILPAAGTEATNPISGTGPLTASQTAGYRFDFVTPEPGSLLVLGSGLAGLMGLVSRRRKA